MPGQLARDVAEQAVPPSRQDVQLKDPLRRGGGARLVFTAAMGSTNSWATTSTVWAATARLRLLVSGVAVLGGYSQGLAATGAGVAKFMLWDGHFLVVYCPRRFRLWPRPD
jgi:hypothetical protein